MCRLTFSVVMDTDLRFALERDVIQHHGCMIYIHKVNNAKGQERKIPGSSGPSVPLEVSHHLPELITFKYLQSYIYLISDVPACC